MDDKIRENDDEKFWIQMSVLEICAQADFAKMAYNNIGEKPEQGKEKAVFSSIHSFLSHCAMISKLLQAKGSQQTIENILDVPRDSIINKRKFRNHLEHYDAELKAWIRRAGEGASVVNHHVGSRADFPIKNALFVSFYDPFTKICTFVDRDFNLEEMFIESQEIRNKADKWLVLHPMQPI